MSAIDEYQSEYVRETGDFYPERPRRLYVKRFPSRYTRDGIAWIEECRDRQMRFLDWMLERLKVSAEKVQFHDVRSS